VSITTVEELPAHSQLARVYDADNAEQCKNPVPYKFHTIICPPVEGGCEIKGLSAAKVTTADKNSVYKKAVEVFQATHIWWDHNGKRHYYPRLK
jgi:hypothetical protein